jgi:hypothetical protein
VFSSAMELDDDGSDIQSNMTSTVKAGAMGRAPVITVAPDAPFVSDVPNNIPTRVEIDDVAFLRQLSAAHRTVHTVFVLLFLN